MADTDLCGAARAPPTPSTRSPLPSVPPVPSTSSAATSTTPSTAQSTAPSDGVVESDGRTENASATLATLAATDEADSAVHPKVDMAIGKPKADDRAKDTPASNQKESVEDLWRSTS